MSLSLQWPQRKVGLAGEPPSTPQKQPAASEEAPRAPGKAARAAHQADDDVSPEEALLRQFDLAGKYGPAVGMSRLERFQRAANFGLEPPQQVHDIIMAHGGPGSRADQCLWHNRV